MHQVLKKNLFLVKEHVGIFKAANNFDIHDPDTGEVIDTRGNPANGAQFITDDAGLVNDFYRPALLTDKYRDYLPSINLNFKLSDSEQLRFAAAKVLGRAPINRLFANATLRVEDVQAFRDQDTGEIVLSKPTAVISGTKMPPG